LGRFGGFATGWTYWAVWVSTCMAEITVAGKYVKYWFPIPEWVTALVVLGALFAANLISVRLFGEAEFWFSAVKVTAIVATIVIGVGVLIFGFGHTQHSTIRQLWNDDGIFPNGFGQALLALQLVVFAYVGVELVGVTAGEAANPRQSLRKAINTIPMRIGLFYVGALIVVMSLVGWREFHAGRSPFVEVFAQIGIPGAAGLVDCILLTAALSSCNSGIYSTGRMLRSLSLRREAPAALGRLNRHQVPYAGIAVSAAVMVIGVVVNLVSPDRAFTYITSVSTTGIIFVWGVILVCHLAYRAKARQGELPVSDYRLPGAPVSNIVALAFLALVVVLLFFSHAGRTALLVGLAWAVLVCVGYRLANRSIGTRWQDPTERDMNVCSSPRCALPECSEPPRGVQAAGRGS
jgi:amino acid transporter, AAT family